MLTIKNLVKTYDNGHQAVKGIDLEVQTGEFIVLVGPSGCGKSSILRSIAGLESITSGEIHLFDRRIDQEAPAKRDIAMVFQNYALYPHMSVYDNLAYGLKNRGVDKNIIDQKIRQVADILKIDSYLDRKPSKLSGGQRQRVAMGRAIVRDPKLFLFDEPLSNLDAALRAHMRLEIKRLQTELKVTSFYVTHDQVEAMTLADRIVVLNQGKAEQIGTPSQVYHQPASTFVASFMGSPAMNFTSGAIQQGQLYYQNQVIGQLDANHTAPEDQRITLGFRPEHISLEPLDSGLSLEVNIDAIEPLGPNQLVHARLPDGTKVIATTPEIDFDLNTSHRIYIALNNLHLFDRSERRIETQVLDSKSQLQQASS
ncbi:MULTISPECIES: sn-glycerol-3-phosphate ABC transporter ATP-binding protein UgpC [unclassified Vibrio]|uniref:Sn-glycerol-3-phosphate ABC transporter ATP-binding protein UgpC n=1 Tax=Vibrio sp. HB236076 TaxID=3232307 RepID=A0AB39HL27_9VIBR|nr:sn-glycerol-3-phosphate ABC transporter ATP-binding protein UgpC [Vibrio sp. HB161653]MDP5253281.1 sn-glycerol-3-phosphate ABC transporter ATP-binding protein UgpC [Vibrio sp. HB161653]